MEGTAGGGIIEIVVEANELDEIGGGGKAVFPDIGMGVVVVGAVCVIGRAGCRAANAITRCMIFCISKLDCAVMLGSTRGGTIAPARPATGWIAGCPGGAFMRANAVEKAELNASGVMLCTRFANIACICAPPGKDAG